jgi:hypothetical protein
MSEFGGEADDIHSGLGVSISHFDPIRIFGLRLPKCVRNRLWNGERNHPSLD